VSGIYHKFTVSPAEHGGYILDFPALPGCMTQVSELSQIPEVAVEIYELWCETSLLDEGSIPRADADLPDDWLGLVISPDGGKWVKEVPA
jgi:predicted RNase H-like HicB family nuclease